MIVRNGIGDQSSNPEQGCLHFILCQRPGKHMNPSVSTPWVNSRADCFLQALVRQLVQEKENSKLKSALLHIKIAFESHLTHDRGVAILFLVSIFIYFVLGEYILYKHMVRKLMTSQSVRWRSLYLSVHKKYLSFGKRKKTKKPQAI